MLKRIISNNHFLSLASSGVTAGIGLLTFMLLARNYSKEEFGLWILYLTGYSFAEMFKSGLLHSALIKHVAGQEDLVKKSYIGSSWAISLLITAIVAIIIYGLHWLFKDPIESVGLTLFFKYYPLLSLLILPVNYTEWISQSEEKFNRIFWLKCAITCSFFLVVAANLFITINLEQLVILHLSIHALVSLVLLVIKASGIGYLGFSNRKNRKELLNFGKYSFGTLIGTNLLKSADTFLIGFFIGPSAVALYSVPLRLTEMMEMPVRSLVSNALPKIASAGNKQKMDQVRDLFYQYSGALSLFFVPFMVMAFIFSEELVVLAGGAKYAEAAIIFRVFCVYGLFLSLDRFTGVTLDAINQPKYNLIKVIGMATVNIVGDVLVLTYYESVVGVALVTIATVLTGVFSGFLYLNRHVRVKFFELMAFGWRFLAGFRLAGRRQGT